MKLLTETNNINLINNNKKSKYDKFKTKKKIIPVVEPNQMNKNLIIENNKVKEKIIKNKNSDESSNDSSSDSESDSESDSNEKTDS